MSTNRKKNQSGFTLVEMMMAVMATAILVLAVGIMLVYAFQGWRQNAESVQLQLDTSLAMRVMAKEIRRTPWENMDDGSTLVCTNASGVVSITQNGGSLTLQENAETPFILVSEFVTRFDTKKQPDGSVRVRLDLATGSDISTNAMVIYSRN